MEKVLCIENAEHVKILMDRKRLEVLRVLRENNKPMTAKQIADALGLKPATVSFHTSKLCSIGVLHIVRTEIVNGIIAKFLEPTAHHFKIIAKDEVTTSLVSQQMAESAENMYNNAKDLYVENMQKNKMSPKRISLCDVYLTKDEFTKINEMIDRFIQESSEKSLPQKRHYKMFITFADCDDEVDETFSCC